jgi:hypothetical protein
MTELSELFTEQEMIEILKENGFSVSRSKRTYTDCLGDSRYPAETHEEEFYEVKKGDEILYLMDRYRSYGECGIVRHVFDSLLRKKTKAFLLRSIL